PRSLSLVARHADAWITFGGVSDLSPVGNEAIVRAPGRRLDDARARMGRDPSSIQRIYLIGNTEERPLASVAAFDDFVGRYAGLGFTTPVFTPPPPDAPVWNEPEAIVEAIATEVLPRRRS